MNRTQVTSSNIKSIGYDGTTLEVEFKNGAIWQYKDVPREKYDELMSAPSIGSYFAKNIKGKFEEEKQ